ncbi:MAG: sel1 repeat family protein, partial [bacterium]|nr:sel1 repeat family protein [Candidatus Minthenecus merdequi]
METEKTNNFADIKKSAENGNAKSQCNLGIAYLLGNGVEKNYEEALKWLKKSAENGNARGQYNLGVAYLSGEGVEKNYEEALK